MTKLNDKYKDNAGHIKTSRSRASGAVISMYNSKEQGIESDPDLPFSLVCETHGTVICHSSYKLAVSHMPFPHWCAYCQDIIAERKC